MFISLVATLLLPIVVRVLHGWCLLWVLHWYHFPWCYAEVLEGACLYYWSSRCPDTHISGWWLAQSSAAGQSCSNPIQRGKIWFPFIFTSVQSCHDHKHNRQSPCTDCMFKKREGLSSLTKHIHKTRTSLTTQLKHWLSSSMAGPIIDESKTSILPLHTSAIWKAVETLGIPIGISKHPWILPMDVPCSPTAQQPSTK